MGETKPADDRALRDQVEVPNPLQATLERFAEEDREAERVQFWAGLQRPGDMRAAAVAALLLAALVVIGFLVACFR